MTMKSEILNTNNYYRTSDLALVVAMSLSFPIEALERESSGKVYFLFRKNNEGFEDTLQKYWSRELRIEPQAFFNQLKVIKARIYSGE